MDLAQIFTKLFLGIPRSYKIIIQTKKNEINTFFMDYLSESYSDIPMYCTDADM